jgi:hypothetical protein
MRCDAFSRKRIDRTLTESPPRSLFTGTHPPGVLETGNMFRHFELNLSADGDHPKTEASANSVETPPPRVATPASPATLGRGYKWVHRKQRRTDGPARTASHSGIQCFNASMLALHLLQQSRRRTTPLQRQSSSQTTMRIFSVWTQVLVAVDAVDGKTKVSSNNEATW